MTTAQTAKQATGIKKCSLSDVTWEALQKMTLAQRATYFNSDHGEHHVLIAQQFNRQRLEEIGRLATTIRRIAKTDEGALFLKQLLVTKRAMLYFTQPSSRTFLSFRSACSTLGIDSSEIRDTSTSSEVKGETQEDSVRTFSSYCDLIVMRTPDSGFAERVAWVLSNTFRPLPVLNAGSGKDQHPTQAVLDIYTLQRSFEEFGGIDGKKIMFVGDLRRGRTVRSLSFLLTNYRNVTQYFVAPDELQISEDIQGLLNDAGVEYHLSRDFEKLIPKVDAIYMTRIQDEWDSDADDSRKIDISAFCFRAEHLAKLGPNAIIMHPFPRRQEIDLAVDGDRRAMYWRQMRNGMWIRAALIAGIFGRDADILEYADRHAS